MTETQLIYFSAITQYGSYSEAAFMLNISQSSISKQIMQLEDELGVKLFDRTSRKAKLTEAGVNLVQDAQAILERIQKMKRKAIDLSYEGHPHLTLLALPIIGHYNFYLPIQLFKNQNDNCHVELIELEEPDMYRRIDAGDYDAAITYFNPDRRVRGMRFIPLFEDEMVLVCHKNNPLSEKLSVCTEDLDGQPLLAMNPYTCVQQLYEQYFDTQRFKPNIVFQGRPETIQVGAEAEQGSALLTRVHTNPLRINNVVLLPFSPPLTGRLGIYTKPEAENDPLLQALIESLQSTPIF